MREASSMTNVKVVHVNWYCEMSISVVNLLCSKCFRLLESLRSYMKQDESKFNLADGPAPPQAKGNEGGGLSPRDLHLVQMLYISYVEGLRELIDRCEKKKMREYRALRRSASLGSSGTTEGGKQEADMDKFLESVLGNSKGDEELDEDDEEKEDESEEEGTDYGTSESDSGEGESYNSESSSNSSNSSNAAADAEDADFVRFLFETLLTKWEPLTNHVLPTSLTSTSTRVEQNVGGRVGGRVTMIAAQAKNKTACNSAQIKAQDKKRRDRRE